MDRYHWYDPIVVAFGAGGLRFVLSCFSLASLLLLELALYPFRRKA